MKTPLASDCSIPGCVCNASILEFLNNGFFGEFYSLKRAICLVGENSRQAREMSLYVSDRPGVHVPD